MENISFAIFTKSSLDLSSYRFKEFSLFGRFLDRAFSSSMSEISLAMEFTWFQIRGSAILSGNPAAPSQTVWVESEEDRVQNSRFISCTIPRNNDGAHHTLYIGSFIMTSLASSFVLITPSLARVRRPCRGLGKFFLPCLQCNSYGCSIDAQENVHTGHGLLYFFLFPFFETERCLPKVS